MSFFHLFSSFYLLALSELRVDVHSAQDNGLFDENMKTIIDKRNQLSRHETYHRDRLRRNIRRDALHEATEAGNVNEIIELLNRGADINSKNVNGYTPLHIVSWKGYKTIADLLLERNASVDIVIEEVGTRREAAIHIAVMHNDLNITKALLDHGANINRKGSNSETPLHIAARYGHEKIVDLLLKRNASLYTREKEGFTPLHIAVCYNNLNITKAFLNHGTDINIKGLKYETPLHIAARKGYETMVHLLLERNASVDILNDHRNAPIHDAVYNNYPKVTKALLDHGAHINSRGYLGRTPLHIVSMKGNKDILNLLLERKGSVHARDMQNETALHLAVYYNNMNVVQTLLDHGAGINSRGHLGQTPLHIAAEKGHESILELLLSRNASVNIPDTFNDKPIHKTFVNGDLKVIMPLLDLEVNINVKGAAGNTLFNSAVRVKSNNLKESTIPYYSQYNTNLTKFMRKNQTIENKIIILMQMLIERGADVNSQNHFGQTALHEAVDKGYVTVVEYLLSQNASLGIDDYTCSTPLQRAATKLNFDVIKTLLNYGDDINRIGCNNITALYLAIEKNNTMLTKFLLSNNADPNVMSIEGKTPLDEAFSKSSKALIEILLEHGAKVEDKSFLGSKILFNAVSKRMLKLIKLLLNRTESLESYPTVILNYAIKMRFLKGVQLLIKYGANIEKKDIHGNLPLSSAVISKNLNMFKLILQASTNFVGSKNLTKLLDAKSEVLTSQNNLTEIHTLTALHIASYYGLVEIVNLLISKGASLEVKDERGYTPLHYSCGKGHFEVAKLLLDFGANKNSADINGTTPLHIACRLGLVSIAELLLSAPLADFEKFDNYGYNSLHYASLRGSKEIVELLLKHNAYTEAKTNDLKTPVLLASMEGHREVILVLLYAGADITASDIDGMTALHFAAREKKFVFYDMTELYVVMFHLHYVMDKKGNTPLHLACGSNSNPDALLQLLIYLPVIDTPNYDLMTPLHIASRDNTSDCVGHLISHGADVFRRDQLLNYPVHYAALKGNTKILSMLLEKDPILSSSVNSDQETPLFIASREGHTDAVRLILAAGVEGLSPDIHGRTALHRCACRGHFEIVKLIREQRVNEDKEDEWGFTALNYAASWKGHQEVIGYLSTSMLNVTRSYYLEISNPS